MTGSARNAGCLLRWSANPHTGDNGALVHEGLTMQGGKPIVEPCLACLA